MSFNNLFNSVFSSMANTTHISIPMFLLCLGVSLVVGLFIAITYTYKSKYTKSFVITLATLPAVVAIVIMMVNGNLGAGVAVAGAFSLVRFRSVPGTAKEISAIFLAMSAGLALGMGYLGYAVLFTVIISLISMLYNRSSFGNAKPSERTLKITIPEDLDYTNIFDDLFNTYTTECDLVSVKSTNMGSLFKLTYSLKLSDVQKEKAFIDELRCRNGNLEIMLAKQTNAVGEL